MTGSFEADDLRAIHEGLVTGGLPDSAFHYGNASSAAAVAGKLMRSAGPEITVVAGVVAAVARNPVIAVGNDRLAAALARTVCAMRGMDLALEADDPRFRELYGEASQLPIRDHKWLAGRLTRLERAAPVEQLSLPGMDGDEPRTETEGDRVPAAAVRGDSPKVYVASALTRLSPSELEEIETQSDCVAIAFSGAGYMVHQPAVHTHPARTGDMPHREVHSIDYGYVSNADVLILLGQHASTGAGKELVWAERHLLTIVVAVPAGTPVSRLLTGSTGDVRVVRFLDAEDLAHQMRKVAAELRSAALDHMRNRLSREDQFLEPWLALRRRLLSQPIDPAMAARHSITLDRIQEILRSPTHYAGASLEEINAVDLCVAQISDNSTEAAPPAACLGVEDVNALADAQEIEGWSLGETYELARLAEGYLASAGGPRRLRFTTASDWIDFKRAMHG